MVKRIIPETISEEEFIQLISGVKKPHHKLSFILGFYACMRVSEVVNLKPENVDIKQRLIRIKQAKGKKDRNVPLPKQAVRGVKNLPVGIGERSLQIAIKKYGKKMLDKDIHFHTLRHSGATHYLNKKKWSLRHIQQLLGHSQLSTTAIYTHVNPDELISKMWEEKE